MRLSFGFSVVTMYFLCFYILPMIGLAIMSDDVPTIYKIVHASIYSNLLLFSIYGLYFLLLYLPPISFKLTLFKKNLIINLAEKLGIFYKRNRLTFAFLFFIFSLIFFISEMSDYRNISGGMLQTLSITGWLTVIFNIIAILDIFYCVFMSTNHLEKVPVISFYGTINKLVLSRRRIGTIIISISLILSANGTASILTALIGLIYSLSPVNVEKFIYTSRFIDTNKLIMSGVRNVSFLMFFIGMFTVAWSSGELIKSHGSESNVSFLSMFENVLNNSYITYIIVSISHYYYTLTFTVDNIVTNFNEYGLSTLKYPLSSFVFRLDILLAGIMDISRPEIGSFSRLNYIELTSQAITERQGTSAGLIGSFNYVFVFPLNLIFCSLYMLWLSRLIDRLLIAHHRQSLSLIGTFLITVFFILVFFQSPFDFLIIIENAVITVIGFYLLSLVAKKNASQNTKY